MTAPVRLLLFGVLLVAVFVAAFAIGSAVNSDDSAPRPAHQVHEAHTG